MTLPLALNSEPWKIFTLTIDSIDFPSMGLMTLNNQNKTTALQLMTYKCQVTKTSEFILIKCQIVSCEIVITNVKIKVAVILPPKSNIYEISGS